MLPSWTLWLCLSCIASSRGSRLIRCALSIDGETHTARNWYLQLKPFPRTRGLPSATWVSLEADHLPVEHWDVCGPSWHLDYSPVWDSGTQLTHTWISDPQKLWDNKCLLQAVEFGGKLLRSNRRPMWYTVIIYRVWRFSLGGRDRSGVWDWHVHTAIFKTDNQQGPTV